MDVTEDADKSYIVELARTGACFKIFPNETILNVILKAGLRVPYLCGYGACGVCRARVLEGEPADGYSYTMAASHPDETYMLICCTGAKSARLVLDL